MAGMPRHKPPPLLDAETARFIAAGVSIAVATRDPRNVPAITLAMGCTVSPDRRRVTVIVLASQSSALLRNLAGQREIAAVFSQPSTHRTIQLKGEDAAIVPTTPEDVGALAQQLEGLVANLASVGYEDSFARALWASTPEDLVAIAFTPTAAYAQTPGPQAGAPLHAGPAT